MPQLPPTGAPVSLEEATDLAANELSIGGEFYETVQNAADLFNVEFLDIQKELSKRSVISRKQYKRLEYPETKLPDGVKYSYCPICKGRATVLALAKDNQPCLGCIKPGQPYPS
jgi:hypothetical protein